MFPRRSPFLAGALMLLASCASSRATGTFEGNVYREGPIAFQLGAVPPSWRRVEVTQAAIAFRDDAHGASILINARCHKPDADTPLLALTNHLVIGSTEREVLVQNVEPFDGREALHTSMRGKWDGVVMALDIFVLKKDGCIYDFVYTGAPAAYEAGASDFEQYVRSFKTLRGSGVVG